MPGDEVVTALGTSTMPDRAAIFTGILARNALRREAQLPQLNVRVTFESEVDRALWVEHVLDHLETVQAEVLRVERETRGPTFPESAGGHWIVAARVRATLVETFWARRRHDRHCGRALAAKFSSP